MKNKIEFIIQGSKNNTYLTYFKLNENNTLEYAHCNCMSYKMKKKCKHIDGLLNSDNKIKIIEGSLEELSQIKNENSDLASNEIELWEQEITKLENKLSEARIELMKAKDIFYRTLK